MTKAKALSAVSLAVLLALQACSKSPTSYDPGDFKSPTDPTASYLELTSQNDVTELAADGSSSLKLTATLTGSTEERMIEFTTSRGTFVGAPTAPFRTRTIRTSQGVAVVELKSDTSVGLAVVTVKVTGENSIELTNTLEINFRAPDFDEVLRIELGKRKIEANGFETTKLTAYVGERIADRSVEFETTDGTLVGGTAQGDAREVTADAAGKAEIRLRAGTRPTFAEVTARIMLDENKSVERRAEVEFQLIRDPDNILKLDLGKTALAADGIDTTEIKATINTGLLPSTVEFQTTKGALIGGNIDNGVHTISADQGGQATIRLRSSLTPEFAEVTARVMLDDETPFERRRSVEFTPIQDLDSILRFTQAPDRAPADGDTASIFVVKLSEALVPGTVMFKTTSGSFSQENASKVETNVEVGPGNTEARVILYSAPSVGLAELTAGIGAFERSTLIDFFRALPDRIDVRVSPESVEDKPDTFVSIEADFRRSVGSVTIGTVPTFRVTDKNGVAFGNFKSVMLSDSNTRVSAQFSPGGSGRLGTATVTVGAEGTSVTGTATLKVVAPTP